MTEVIDDVPVSPKIELAAKVAHAVNRVYCQSIGDASQLPWDDAPEWQRISIIKGVQFLIDNPEAGPRQSHEAWLDHKYSEGWTYGETKNADFRTHPCIMPYDELPAEHRVKDDFFHAVVRTILAS